MAEAALPVRWRVTYVANASDSSLPHTEVDFYAPDSVGEAAWRANVLVDCLERDGAKILTVSRDYAGFAKVPGRRVVAK